MLSEDLATQFQSGAGGLIFEKALKVKASRTHNEIALLGDLTRSYENLRAAASLPMAIFGFIGGVIVLVMTIGLSSIAGLGVLVFILILNVGISQLSHSIEVNTLALTKNRISTLDAIIGDIRSIKVSWVS